MVVMGLWLYTRVYRPLVRVRELARRLLNRESTEGYMQEGEWGISEMTRTLRDLDDELERLYDQVDNEERGLEGVLKRMVEGVVILNADGTVRMTNPPFCELFEYEEDPQGRRLYEICREMEVRQAADLALLDGRSGRKEIVIRDDPGHVQRLQVAMVSYAPLEISGDEKAGAVLVFHDISRIKQLEMLRTEFVANLSHEVRTPLSIFKGYLETLVEDETMTAEERKRALLVVKRHSERMHLLVEDLLTLSRFEAADNPLEMESIEVGPFMERVCEDCRQLLSEDETDLILLIDEDLPELQADRMRLEQVFYNLVDNALRHSGSTDRIEIGVYREESRQVLEFYVRDYGAGIPSDKLNHIFERFYRGDRGRARQTGGTGLGLSIVKHIIQLHDGRVWAESALGQGACVRFTLPLAEQKTWEPEKPLRVSGSKA